MYVTVYLSAENIYALLLFLFWMNEVNLFKPTKTQTAYLSTYDSNKKTYLNSKHAAADRETIIRDTQLIFRKIRQ